MPAELRQLVFTYAELREALDAYSIAGGAHVPPGAIQRVNISGDGQSVAITTRDDLTGTTFFISTGVEGVAVALIAFCARRSIPLPLAARKYLVEAGGMIGIRLVSASEQVVEIVESGVDTGRAKIEAGETPGRKPHLRVVASNEHGRSNRRE